MNPATPLPNPQTVRSIYSIKLDVFEGPLDLLLHLIQKNEMDIRDIHLADITEQYLEYLDFMEMLDLDVASEFLVMAATLLQLKSQSILPSTSAADSQNFKNREELVKQLLEYKQFKEAAQVLDHYAERRGQLYGRNAPPHTDVANLREYQIRATLFDLIAAFQQSTEKLLRVDDAYEELHEEPITIEEKITFLERRLIGGEPVRFDELFSAFASKIERIVTFLAILELMRLQKISAVQSAHFDELYIVKREA
jgi:segregation and condensation protein A